jgi:hypothetical protein
LIFCGLSVLRDIASEDSAPHHSTPGLKKRRVCRSRIHKSFTCNHKLHPGYCQTYNLMSVMSFYVCGIKNFPLDLLRSLSSERRCLRGFYAQSFDSRLGKTLFVSQQHPKTLHFIPAIKYCAQSTARRILSGLCGPDRKEKSFTLDIRQSLGYEGGCFPGFYAQYCLRPILRLQALKICVCRSRIPKSYACNQTLRPGYCQTYSQVFVGQIW